MKSLWLSGAICLAAMPALLSAADAPPRSLDKRVTIELFAESPQIKTPTGMNVSPDGRVWAIESNTHFRPENYDGPPSDRLLILSDENEDGRCETVKVFADGFTHAMSVTVRPEWLPVVKLGNDVSPATTDETLQVFLATRREILLLEDLNNDDVCDRQTRLAWLETQGDYPHNGLAGFAFDALGWMYFGFGENLGEPYELFVRVPDDDAEHRREAAVHPLKGEGEGGNIYRMRPNGSQLAHWATGFWNPHASCFDAFGRLFTVDNDPDSRPPCRLLHVIKGGDYGYRFRNGRKGLHPFTAWDGEVPGTLPMVAGTGEAPSGVLAYEHGALPEEYRGRLFVTSWGDHRIDTFELQRRGASFESVAKPLIVGGEDFRPVGIAQAPDGSLYCTDWVLRDYKLHGQGRIWRIRVKRDSVPKAASSRDENDLASPVLDRRRLAAQALAKTENGRRQLVALVFGHDPIRQRMEALWALANVPVDVAQLNLLERRESGQLILNRLDALSLELASLTGRPQIGIPWTEVTVSEGSAHSESVASVYDPHAPWDNLPENANDPLWLTAAIPLSVPMMQQGRQSAGIPLWLGLCSPDPFVAMTALEALATHPELVKGPIDTGNELGMARWLILHRRLHRNDFDLIRQGLSHSSPMVRRVAVQWVAEEHLEQLRDEVDTVLRSEPMTADLFLATLAAIEMLDGRSPTDFDKTPPSETVLPLLKANDVPSSIKAQALRLISPDDSKLTIDLLKKLSASESQELRLESVRSLAQTSHPEAVSALLPFVSSPPTDPASPQAKLFSEAVLGLAPARWSDEQAKFARAALIDALQPGNKRPELAPVLAAGVMRSLRGTAPEPSVQAAIKEYGSTLSLSKAPTDWTTIEIARQTALLEGQDTISDQFQKTLEQHHTPTDNDEWRLTLLEESKDTIDLAQAAQRGRLVFFHSQGPGCMKCHTVEGRGGQIGPDLSHIGGALSRKKLIDSILEPSKEIAPQFTNWNMVSTDGRIYTGMIVHENKGVTVLGQPDGKTITLETKNVEERMPQSTSVMPEKLEERMTVQEFADLLAFLQSLK